MSLLNFGWFVFIQLGSLLTGFVEFEKVVSCEPNLQIILWARICVSSHL